MIDFFNSSQGKIFYKYINNKSNGCLVLLHGFMEDHQCWEGLFEKLPVNILMPDLVGHGNSIPNESFDFSMQQHATAINELLNSFELNKIYVLGHSMGGYITLELSLLNPDINIGLLHSTCVEDNAEKKSNRNKTIQVLKKDPSIFIREFYWNLFAEHKKVEHTYTIEKLKQKAEKIPVTNIIQTVKALRDRKEHTYTWKHSKGKNIMIAGTYDKLWNRNDLQELAILAETEFAELFNSGHMGFYEEPEKLQIIIKSWLNIT